MRNVVLSLLVTSAFLAGCADGSDDPAPVEADPGVQFESDVLQLSLPTMPRDPPASGERTLGAAPEWRLGEWWTYTMTEGFGGETYEFTRVVAGQDTVAGNYLVGFPIDGFSNDVMLMHVPGYGDIRMVDLAYETHDAYFQPLSFPLTEGKSWDAEFEGLGMGPASVVSVSGSRADIQVLAGGNYAINATYDAEMGEISKMHVTQGGGLYATYEITGHGYDYEGVVRVPHAHDLIFIHGRLGPVCSVGSSAGGGPVPGPCQPKAVTETVEVEAGYDRASFIMAVGAGPFLGTPNQAPVGFFQETATAPDNTQYQLQLMPHEGGFKIGSFGHDDPTGTWTLEHLAGGAGIAFIEGIGFHSIDVDLPSGCVVNSLNAQHHSADCKIDSDMAGSITPTPTG